MLTQPITSFCNKAIAQPRAKDIFRVNSGVRQASEDQTAELIAKIKEHFPKYAGDEEYIKEIVGISDKRLVRIHSAYFLCPKSENKLETCMYQFLGSYI